MSGFVHLRVTSCYSFLRGAGHPEEYAERAAELGMSACALAEEDYLCGLVRFEGAARAAGVRPILGGGVTGELGPVAFLCRNRDGYRQLCRLVSRAHLAHPRGEPFASLADYQATAGDGFYVLTGGRRGPLAQLLRQGDEPAAERWLRRLCAWYGRPQVVVELQRLGCPGDDRLVARQVALARRLGLRYAATCDVRYVRPDALPLYDILVCTRHLQTVDTPFAGRPVNDLQFLASGKLMRQRFADLPEAIDETERIAAGCAELELSADRIVPSFNGVPEAEQAALLGRLAFDGLRERYPRELWRKVETRLWEELRIIHTLRLEGYFLLVWDVCRWAREQGIRCAGRGSAAGSVACYVLRITNVDAYRRDITPARFLNEERTESLPDIDVDFDRDGRDPVIDYLVARYGSDCVALTGTFQRYHARSAIRDVGRALALPPEDVDRLAKSLPSIAADRIDEAGVKMPDVRHSPWAEARYDRLRELVPRLAGIPRHLGTHLGGVIISPTPLSDHIGVQWAAKPFRVVQGDKEDVEDRLCKFDCLCLPMFSVLEAANRFIRLEQPEFEIFDVPIDDEATYARIRRSETVGAFEVGSPAQRALHARLHCDCFEPLVAALALIRPGPIKGNMVEHYLKRRHGEEPIEYWLPGLEPVLAKTYGVLVYQEQVIEVARIAGGLTPAEGDILRRGISHYRSDAAMQKLGESFCAKAVANGIRPELAAAIFEAVQAFAGYGFCESHAAAFADTAYRSVYLIEHHPAAYFAGLLRNQPMGFYPMHTIVGLVQRRGIEVVPPCLNTGPARTEARGERIHLGLAQIKRITRDAAEAIVAGRPYRSLGDLQRRAGLPRDRLISLVRAGACDCLSDHRRMLLWQIHELPGASPDGAPRLDFELPDPPLDQRLPRFEPWDQIAGEWDNLGFSLSGHPVALARAELARSRIEPVAATVGAKPDTRFRVAGLVMRPHRPPTRTGRNTLFFDLEDETGIVSVTCFREVYQRDGHLVLQNPMVVVDGKIDRRTGQSLIADRVRAMPATVKRASSPHARTLY